MINSIQTDCGSGSFIEGVQLIDAQWRYIFVDDVAAGQANMPIDSFKGFTMMEKNPGIEKTPLFVLLKKCMKQRKSLRYVNHYIVPGQPEKWFDLSIRPDGDGLRILSLDITAHVETENKLHKLNDLYAFLSLLNQNIARVTEQESLFANACLLAHVYGKFSVAWIGLFNDRNDTITLVNEKGLLGDDFKLFKNAAVTANDPQNTVLATDDYYICNDVSENIALKGWKAFTLRHGINSCMVLPIRKSGKIIGTFNLYSDKNAFIDTDEIDLLVELTTDISFALDRFENVRKHEKAEALVIESEMRLRHTLDGMIEGAQIHDFEWKFLYVNKALVASGTYLKEELLGYTLMEKYPGIEQTNLFKKMKLCMDTRESQQLESELIFPDGTKAWFEFRIQPIPEGIFILSVDRTEQQKAKEKVEKVNRLYAFNSAINQSIVHIKKENALLRNACIVAKKIGAFKLAWIGLYDSDMKTVSLVAQSGVAKSDIKAFKNISCSKNTPHGFVLRTGGYYTCDDIDSDPNLDNWRPFAAKYGIRSGIVLPIKKGGNVIGTFNLYSDKLNFADEEEIKLLEEVTGDISFALDIFEKTKKHEQTEALLTANEKKFRALIEKSPDMKTLSDLTGALLYGSPAATKTLGYASEEFLGTSILKYIHPDERHGFIEQRNAIIDHPGKSFSFHLRLQHKSGRWVWCEGTVTNMMHESGVNAFVANFMDVSEKESAEQLRKFEQNNLDALINNTDDLMWSVGTDMNLITANRRFDEMTLKINNQIIERGSNILSGAPATQRKRFKEYYGRAFAGEAFKEIEHGAAPVEYYSEISFYPIRKDNDVIGTACHSRDITATKKLESELLKSEVFNREVLNSLSANIAVINSDGNVIAVNEAWRLFGRDNGRTILNDPEERNYFEVCAKSARLGNAVASEVLTGLKDVMDNKKSQYYLEYACHSESEQRWFAMLAKPFQGNEQLVVVAHYDISERKSAQEKLMRNNEELLKTNFELDRFAYSVSHDLRAPLTSILGLANFIEEETQETDTLHHAQLIKTRILRLDGFIRNILNYSRSNRTELKVEKVNLTQTFSEIVDFLCIQKECGEFVFYINVDEKAPFYSDRQNLVTVIENIVSNAMKFTDSKKAENHI